MYKIEYSNTNNEKKIVRGFNSEDDIYKYIETNNIDLNTEKPLIFITTDYPDNNSVEPIKIKNKDTKRLHISMTYTFVGDTGIDIPLELLKGKSEEEQYDIAYAYAKNHIDEIPVAVNCEYLKFSDDFDIDDIDFDEN